MSSRSGASRAARAHARVGASEGSESAVLSKTSGMRGRAESRDGPTRVVSMATTESRKRCSWSTIAGLSGSAIPSSPEKIA